MKRLNLKVRDPFYARMEKALAESHHGGMSELIRSGIARELDKLGI